MKKGYLLGVDLGTTAIKIGIFDLKGKKVAVTTEDYDLLTPAPLQVEYPAEKYWDAFKDGLHRLVEKSGVDAKQILSLSISAQGETMVFLDDNGEPLHNFIVWLDNRAQEESDYLEKRFTRELLHHATGQANMIALSPGAKILWFKRHRPDIFEKISKILLIEDYFFYRMGGIFRAEGSLWCTSFLWDINTRQWWQPMVDELGLTMDQLPQLCESGVKIGTILPSIALELGLSENLALIMGVLDQACGGIGVGNVKPGVFSESTGSALVACTMTNEIIIDEQYHLPCFYSAITDMYMIHTFGNGGIALKWVRDALCEKELERQKIDGTSAYQLMDRLACDVPAGSDGLVVLPHFQGAGQPDVDQCAKCSMSGLTLSHTRAHIIRAFMEGVSANIYRMVESVQELMGVNIQEIISLSGGANSPFWCQIKADMLGKPVVTMQGTQDAACLGAAILAGFGIGVFNSVADTALQLAKRNKVYYPNSENRSAYDELIKKYKLLTESYGKISQQL